MKKINEISYIPFDEYNVYYNKIFKENNQKSISHNKLIKQIIKCTEEIKKLDITYQQDNCVVKRYLPITIKQKRTSIFKKPSSKYFKYSCEFLTSRILDQLRSKLYYTKDEDAKKEIIFIIQRLEKIFAKYKHIDIQSKFNYKRFL